VDGIAIRNEYSYNTVSNFIKCMVWFENSLPRNYSKNPAFDSNCWLVDAFERS